MTEQCSIVHAMLPWLLNGTLSSKDTIYTFDHVVTCADCKKELALLAEIQQEAKSGWCQVPAPSFKEQLWKNIQGQQLTEKQVKRKPALSTLKQAIFPVRHIVAPINLAFKTPLELLNNAAKVLAPAVGRVYK